MKKVLVAGSAVVDVVIHVDHLPRRSEDINVYGQDMSLGGCAYNVSDCLRHFNVPFVPFYPVGTGVYGDFVRKKLLEKGIVSAAPVPSEENGCCYCLVEPDGERTFICYHGAEYLFQPGWFDTLNADEIDTVYLCGLEVEETTGINMIEYLERHPEYTIYFAPSARICNIAGDKMDRLLDLHPILHLNLDEATRFMAQEKVRQGSAEGQSDHIVNSSAAGKAAEDIVNSSAAGKVSEDDARPDEAGDRAFVEDMPFLEHAAAWLTRRTGNVVIITLGSKGCYLAYPYKEGELIPAVNLPENHGGDAIGAGDSHIGSVIALRKLGYSFSDAVRMANHVSAAVVCTDGALLSDEQFRKLQLV